MPSKIDPEKLLDWLTEWQSDELPNLTEIGRGLSDPTDGYGVHALLTTLKSDGKIAWRSGTRSENRGHQAVRLTSGRVLKTVGCPFEPPERV